MNAIVQAIANYPANTQEAKSARLRIMNIQAECEALPKGLKMEESPPLRHWLADKVYCREIHLSADSLVVGKIHRHEHMNIISQGRVTVFTEFGLEEITAPASFISKPGTKRVVHTHEDCIWTTIHPNPDNIQDIETLEKLFTCTDYAELGMEVEDAQLLGDAA